MVRSDPRARQGTAGARIAATGLLSVGAMLVAVATWLLLAADAAPIGADLDAIPTAGSAAGGEVGAAGPDTSAAPVAPPAPRDDLGAATELATPPPVAVPAPVRVPEAESDPWRVPVEREAPLPVSLEIPAIGVRADLVDLDLDDQRRLEVPDDAAVPGWYVRSPRPGEDGAAVIAGHVDSYRGPGVFLRLPELAPGDEVVVHREDSSEAVFVVERLGRWPKDEFPTDAVYRQFDGPELRLITCGGVFDTDTRSYEDNIVVFASAA